MIWRKYQLFTMLVITKVLMAVKKIPSFFDQNKASGEMIIEIISGSILNGTSIESLGHVRN